MPFAQPQSGWTAMSLAPNPDKFAAAHVNIDRVSQPQMQLQRSVMPAVTSPVTSPAYQQLQSQIFGGPVTPPLAQQQLAAAQAASQATAAPAQAFAAAEKQLQVAPWTTPTTSTMPKSNFLSPTTGAATKPSGWVPRNLPQI